MASSALRKAIGLMLSLGIERRPLRLLTSEELNKLNELIRRGLVSRADESIVEERLQDALISDDLKEIYPVWNGVPVIQVFEVIDPSKLPIKFSSFNPAFNGSSQAE